MRAVEPEQPADENQAGMSFWEHIDVLRGVVFKAMLLVLIVMVALFSVMHRIFNDVILAPCHSDFFLYKWLEKVAKADLTGLGDGVMIPNFKVELINTELTSQFMIHISTSFWLALLLSMPGILMLFWHFVSPGLYVAERRAARFCLLIGSGLFYVGVAVGFVAVFPLTLRFLASYQLSDLIPNYISINSYMDTLLGLCGAMGLMFELPPVAWLLGRVGVLNRSFFTEYRRHAVVVLLTISAIITPTGDPVTLMLVFIPLYLLWEVSALLVPKADL